MGNASGIGNYLYDDPKLLRQARRRLAKCWHSDKARLHNGLSTQDLRRLSRNDGLLDDALHRALGLAEETRGRYPVFVLPRLITNFNTSKLSLNSSELTFLDEAARQDTILAQQLADPTSTYGFKPAKDCPPCTPDFLIREVLEAAYTPPWSLPAQPAKWRHLPETCASCTWATIHQSFTHFFGDWDIDWRTLTLNLTDLEQASYDGRLPPPGRVHEFWWSYDLDPPKLDSRGNPPSQRRIAFDLFCKYSRVAAKIMQRKVFGINVTEEEGNANPHVLPMHHILNKGYPQVIHLFIEQLAKYGRETEVWQRARGFSRCRKECQAARDVWEQDHRR